MWVVARQQAPRQARLLMCPVSLQALWVSHLSPHLQNKACILLVSITEAAGDGNLFFYHLHAMLSYCKWDLHGRKRVNMISLDTVEECK